MSFKTVDRGVEETNPLLGGIVEAVIGALKGSQQNCGNKFF